MIKKLAISLLCLWAVSANALSNKDLNTLCDPAMELEFACKTYAIGVTEAWRTMRLLAKPDCKKFKTLSPNMVLAAFQAEYNDLDPEKNAMMFLTEHIMDNGGCEEE